MASRIGCGARLIVRLVRIIVPDVSATIVRYRLRWERFHVRAIAFERVAFVAGTRTILIEGLVVAIVERRIAVAVGATVAADAVTVVTVIVIGTIWSAAVVVGSVLVESVVVWRERGKKHTFVY